MALTSSFVHYQCGSAHAWARSPRVTPEVCFVLHAGHRWVLTRLAEPLIEVHSLQLVTLILYYRSSAGHAQLTMLINQGPSITTAAFAAMLTYHGFCLIRLGPYILCVHVSQATPLKIPCWMKHVRLTWHMYAVLMELYVSWCLFSRYVCKYFSINLLVTLNIRASLLCFLSASVFGHSKLCWWMQHFNLDPVELWMAFFLGWSWGLCLSKWKCGSHCSLHYLNLHAHNDVYLVSSLTA